jgi:hypothetical protein
VRPRFHQASVIGKQKVHLGAVMASLKLDQPKAQKKVAPNRVRMPKNSNKNKTMQFSMFELTYREQKIIARRDFVVSRVEGKEGGLRKPGNPSKIGHFELHAQWSDFNDSCTIELSVVDLVGFVASNM